MSNPRCNLPPEEAEAAAKLFPLHYRNYAAYREIFPHYAFVQPMNRTCKAVLCTGSDCGHFDVFKPADLYDDGELFRAKHKDLAMCPMCGQTVTVINPLRFKRWAFLEDRRYIVQLQAMPDGSLLAEGGWASIYYTLDDMRPDVAFRPDKRYYFNHGKRMMWAKVQHPDGLSSWVPRVSISEPINRFMYSRTSYHVFGADSLGFAKYSGIPQFFFDLPDGAEAYNLIKYLGWYTSTPSMEIAARLGLLTPLRDLISGSRNREHYNWKGRTPAEYCRISKADAKALHKAGALTDENIRALHRVGCSAQKLLALGEILGGVKAIATVVKIAGRIGTTPEKGARYLARQFPDRPGTRAGIWEDYLDGAEQLGMDLHDPEVAMPRNLANRHDAVTGVCAIDKIAAKQYNKLYGALCRDYAFDWCGYSVVVPRSADEIVAEGETLHHCVAGYAQRHFAGKTVILFLRKQRRQDRSLVTMEITPRATSREPLCIRQCYGYRNDQRQKTRSRDRFSWFIDAWRGWVEAGSPRDNKGRPIVAGERSA